MKIIIFGCGKIGSIIIESLAGEGHDIVAIDRSAQAVEEVTNTYDVIGLCGNGVDSDTMQEAGIDECDLFVAVTGSDELNMLGCFMARKMGAKYTIARIRNPEYNDESLGLFKQHLDLTVALNPDRSIAHEIFKVLRFPSAVKVDTFSQRNLEIVELIVKADSPFAGMTLAQLRKSHSEKFLVCNVMRDSEIYIPDGNFEIRVGDRIGLTASHSEVLKLLKNLGMPQKQPTSVMLLGASRISYYLAKMLLSAGISVKIIERDAARCAEFSNALPGAVMIAGDGMQQDVLLEEGISSVDAFVALTGTDEENILSSFFAVWQHVPTVIAKVNRPELATTAEMLGLECIVSPKTTVGNILSRYVRALHNSMGSNVETLYKLYDGRAELLEFNVAPDFDYVNIPLRDMTLKPNILIAGIVRGRKPIIPSGDDVILSGDRVIIMAAGHQLNDLSDIVH
ncbi:MAG: Trk system potassium transporter TrkA [Ruminococcaceae bacterium]|nr:Trk system potassium transporter TrkA [Oscillospiraceae bacterium]